MDRHKPIGKAFLSGTAMCLLAMGFIPAAAADEDETEILKITVGEPTKLSDLVNQNTASVAVSRTGVIAAFYPKPGTAPKFYRISRDAGLTWSQEMDFPPEYAGMMSVGLRGGGVLFMLGTNGPVEGDDYTPKHRHVNVRPQPEPVDLTLKSGQLVRGQVVDASGRRIGGVCVVLDQWHCHTDPQGYFHWSVKAPVPQEVAIQVYKKYSHQYETLETTIALPQLESEPITLKNR